MESIYILIPIAILIVTIAVAIFCWAVKNGQFDDLDTEGKRILFDSHTERRAAQNAEQANKPSSEQNTLEKGKKSQ